MSPALALAGAAVGGYLIGAIPFGYLVARAVAGIDIRQHGSGNIGATNVGRVLGRQYFALVFLLDFLKGALPVAAAFHIQTRFHLHSTAIPELAGLAAILGHMFPVYLGFRGGKGVATTIGVLAVLAFWSAAAALLVFLVLLIVFRMVSVGSIGFAIALAAAQVLWTESPFTDQHLARTAMILTIAALIIVRHRGNIQRVLKGSEPKVRLPWSRS